MRLIAPTSRCLIFAMCFAAFPASAVAQPGTFRNVPADSPFVTTQPGATLGTIQPAPGNFDPYAQTYPQTLPNNLPPAYPPGSLTPPGQVGPPAPGYGLGPLRVIQSIDFEYTKLFDLGGDHLGLDEVMLSARVSKPVVFEYAPLEFTPGFAVQYWQGPEGMMVDLPSRTYSAFLDVGWQPQITENLSAELGVRPGVYTDFEETNSDSFRVKGRGLGLYQWRPAVQIVAGVVYLDRFDIKLLPAGGWIWTPNPDTRWEILFPQPKLAQRFTTIGNIEWWWYVAGEYGGDAWTIERTSGLRDAVDYNDIRVIGGLEFQPAPEIGGVSGRIEIGYVWDRELEFVSGPVFKPDDTIMLRGGLSY
ncbi:MAG: hypothetical protein MPJ50_03475 [Pirellulales bacterium]|nr:hypothetical protein [Pirellulales bacterium]